MNAMQAAMPSGNTHIASILQSYEVAREVGSEFEYEETKFEQKGRGKNTRLAIGGVDVTPDTPDTPESEDRC